MKSKATGALVGLVTLLLPVAFAFAYDNTGSAIGAAAPSINFGTSGRHAVAIQYTPAALETDNTIKVATFIDFGTETPTDNLQMDIYVDSSNSFSGSSLGTSAAVAYTSVPSYVSGATITGLTTFTFATPVTLVAGTTYDFVITRSSGLQTYPDAYAVQICGTGCPGQDLSTPVFLMSNYSGTALTHDSASYSAFLQTYSATATSSIDWSSIAFPLVYSTSSAAIAASSSLWAAFATSSQLIAVCSTGNVFGDGFCQVMTYLFVPNPQTLTLFFNIPSAAALRFPFSWIYGVQTEFNTLSASSSSNMLALSFNLGSLGIGSTTPMGNILPNTEVFGTTTIEKYISPTLWAYFQSWIAFALWLGLIADVFFLAKRLSQPH